MKKYLLAAYTGLYSDERIVYVGIYDTKELAVAVCDRYQIEADAYAESPAFKDRYETGIPFTTADDLFRMVSNYSGISFDVREVPYFKE